MPVSQQEDARQRAGYLIVLVSALHSLQNPTKAVPAVSVVLRLVYSEDKNLRRISHMASISMIALGNATTLDQR